MSEGAWGIYVCIYLYIVEISTLSTRITISIGLVFFYHVYFKKEPEGNSSYRVSNSRALEYGYS